MKNSITIIILALIVSGAFITSCSLSNKKAENAQEKVETTMDKAVEFNQERNDSIEQYKKEAQVKVNNFKKSIAELKAKIATEKREDKAIYQKKLNALETKNNEMKESLNNLKDEGQEKWTAFRSEFNHDLDEMGKAFKDLTVNNVN
ncbi:MAG: hypothetical protein PF517_06520 [Salinivirgaceae bacterium]|jgi:cell shape-determining protein MreC|nr:hypothetical protein [Salinivirgaceae bacterium]